jgi:outer membrane protein TolC
VKCGRTPYHHKTCRNHQPWPPPTLLTIHHAAILVPAKPATARHRAFQTHPKKSMHHRLATLLLAAACAATPHAQAQAPAPAAPPSAAVDAGKTSAPLPPQSSLSLSNIPSPAPAVDPSLPPLTLDQCVAMALDKNFDLRIQRHTTESSKDALEITKAEYDPTLRATIGKTYAETDYRPGTGGWNETTGNNIEVTAAAAQKIITGATLQLSTGVNRNSTARNTAYNGVYDSDLVFSVRQPVLKNFGAAVNRAAIDRAHLGISRANEDLRASVLVIIRSVESAYYNLAYYRAQLEVRRFSLDLSQRLLDENRARRAAGVATDLDVLQAEVGVANARNDLLVAEKSLHDAEDNLLALINPFEFAATIGPLAIDDIGAPDVSFDRSYKLALDNTPEYASAQYAIRQYEIDARLAKRNQLPTLEIGAALGIGAPDADTLRAYERALNGHNYNWGVDATFSLPWGRRAEKAAWRQAMNNLDREKIRLRQVDQNILVSVRTAVRAVQTSEEGVRITTLATQLSEKQYELQKGLFDAGKSTFRLVLDFVDDLNEARVRELQARLSLRNALADLARLEATSLARYNVRLDQ